MHGIYENMNDKMKTGTNKKRRDTTKFSSYKYYYESPKLVDY